MLLRAHDEFYLSVRLLLHELFIPLVIVNASASSVMCKPLFIYLFQHPLFIYLFVYPEMKLLDCRASPDLAF